eukprot:scaffold27406_cov56-Cyclotella_meneghiniana.AAC.1
MGLLLPSEIFHDSMGRSPVGRQPNNNKQTRTIPPWVKPYHTSHSSPYPYLDLHCLTTTDFVITALSFGYLWLVVGGWRHSADLDA